MPSKFDKFREKMRYLESRQTGLGEDSTLAARWPEGRLFYEACSRGELDPRLDFLVQQLKIRAQADRHTIATLLRQELESGVNIKVIAVQSAEKRMEQLLGPTGQNFSKGLGLSVERVSSLFSEKIEEELVGLRKKVAEAIDFLVQELGEGKDRV